MYTRQQLDRMRPNELIAALNEAEKRLALYQEAARSRDEVQREYNQVERRASGKKVKQPSSIPLWVKIVVGFIVFFVLGFVSTLLMWLCIIGVIAYFVFRWWERQKHAEEVRADELPAAEQALREAEARVAELEPKFREVQSMMPSGMATLKAVQGIRSELQYGAANWVTAVQNYQIRSMLVDKDTIEFGRYPTEADGTEKPIQWVILAREKDRIFVLSKYHLDNFVRIFDGALGTFLDCCQNSEELEYNIYKNMNEWLFTPWDKSEVRSWLNQNFFHKAFDQSERNRILTVTLDNDSTHLSHLYHYDYVVPYVKSTQDKIFLLSVDEIFAYLAAPTEGRYRSAIYAKRTNDFLSTTPTPYAYNYYCKLRTILTPESDYYRDEEKNLMRCFLLRSLMGGGKAEEHHKRHNLWRYQGYTFARAQPFFANPDEWNIYCGSGAYSLNYFVRPAMWLELYT